MNVSTRARAKTADSVAKQSSQQQQQQRRESSASQPQSNPQSDATVDISEPNNEEPNDIKEDLEQPTVISATTAVAPNTPTNEENSAISIPAQNIRQFKEAVVNTSRLLKVFGDQEKELAKSKAEIQRCNEEIKRFGGVYQNLQRDLDNRTRELAKANAETENAKSLLVLREDELSRVRGLKEDLEAQVSDLRQAQSGADQLKSPSTSAVAAASSSLLSGAAAVSLAQPAKSPNAPLLEEIERLKGELEAKEGTIKSLRISRDGIRSSTRAEVISIQARYAREQAELIKHQEREMAQHRQSLASKEAELEQEQERLMQMEMDLNMRSTQLEDQAAELKTNLDAMTSKYEISQKSLKNLEETQKARIAESKAEVARLSRAAKKDEKRIADLEAALERAKANAKEAAKQKAKARPKSTATAAEAVSAATEDVAEMTMDELREEVAALRVDAVHKDETIRKLGVMVEELERKQNPEGRKPRGRVAVLQAEVDELRTELELRDKKIDALETALKISQGDADDDVEKPVDPAAVIAQLDLKVISLEASLKEKGESIAELERELAEAKEAANERPMRLRHAAGVSSALSPTRAASASRLSSPMSGKSNGTDTADGLLQQKAQLYTDKKTAGFLRAGDRGSVAATAAARGRGGRIASQAGRVRHVVDSGLGDESLYIEVASLRAKVDKMQQERAALQELVTEQQVKIRQLRSGGGTGTAATGESISGRPVKSKQQPQQHQEQQQDQMEMPMRKRRDLLMSETPDEVEQEGIMVASKRLKQSTALGGQGGKRTISRPHSALPSSNGIFGTQQAEAAQKSSSADEPDISSMERLLRNKRINSVNRTKRFFLLLQKSPQIFNQKLLEIPWSIDELDKVEAQQLLMALVATNAAQPGSDIRLVASQRETSIPCEKAGRKLIGLYPSEAEIVASIWTLCFKYSRGEFFNELMKLLAQNIVSPPPGFSVVATCSLVRVFAALSVLAGDIQRVRVMLCDLLMEAVDSAHTLPALSNALSVWPAALSEVLETQEEAGARSSLRLVVRVVQAIAAGIHDLYSEERNKEEADALYQVMVDRCGWRMPGDAEFADKILVEVKETLQALDSDSSDYAVVLCAYNLLSPYVSEAASVGL
ncbi:hypothetical protein LPJ64_003584 [Coemansia asiatica]|uniref:Uncharacterized protein n=1 Tax=Coemansia asiatica TaxID=1052880 RepID=A0A9W7XHN1_9FUNG|nr:hypothetical protein LPJ64_003584 [Coemansia asiatica]